MNTGERLVSISTLANGTALDHFLNISTGAGETIIRVQKQMKATIQPTSIKTSISQKSIKASITKPTIKAKISCPKA